MHTCSHPWVSIRLAYLVVARGLSFSFQGKVWRAFLHLFPLHFLYSPVCLSLQLDTFSDSSLLDRLKSLQLQCLVCVVVHYGLYYQAVLTLLPLILSSDYSLISNLTRSRSCSRVATSSGTSISYLPALLWAVQNTSGILHWNSALDTCQQSSTAEDPPMQ